MQYDRTIKLFGEENFNLFLNTKIIILGVGGVGSFALDCLYNTGITNITIVDFDKYETSNLNRQLGSHGNIGEIKVDALKKRYPKISTINKKITTNWINEFNFDAFDYIVDAIDDIKPKIELIKKYYKKTISSGGSANKIDPLKIEYISIWKTHNDPFIKKIRNELKKNNFKKNFKVIFSSEVPKTKSLGSFEGVTGSFGLAMGSVIIKKILDK